MRLLERYVGVDPPSNPDFAAFVSTRGPALLRFAILLSGSEAEGQDLLADVVEQVYPKWARLRLESPEAYMRRAMTNRMISTWRSPWRRRRDDHVTDLPHREDAFKVVDDRDLILRALRALPPRMRSVIVLRFWLGYSEAETAQVLRCSTGTVKSQGSRGLERLRADLGPFVVEDPRPDTITVSGDAER